MSRVLYFDCFSGISGDMVLGAFLDAGLPLLDLRGALGSLALGSVHVHADRVLRAGVSATKFVVHEQGLAPESHEHSQDHEDRDTLADRPDHVHPHEHSVGHAHSHARAHHHPHRSLDEIFSLVDRSALSAVGKARVHELFHRLAQAEAEVHAMPVEQVHLHEVGAVDSIIDIVGAVYAMEWAGVDRVVCSPLNVGGGMVESAHGLFPVPAPATVRLLQGAPIYSGVVRNELVTPTGALIATAYASEFGPMPAMTVQHVGYGAGTRDNPGTPNVLRLLIGEGADVRRGDRVVVIECEIDDMNPQLFGTAMDRLYAAGALEVFYVSAQMKKNRPGTLLTVIAVPELRQQLIDVVFHETTTIGVRYQEMARDCLKRDWVTVATEWGPVRIKRAWHEGRVINAVPEFEDCSALASTHGVAVKEIQALALSAYGAGSAGKEESPS